MFYPSWLSGLPDVATDPSARNAASSILIGFSMINQPAIVDPPFMETPIWVCLKNSGTWRPFGVRDTALTGVHLARGQHWTNMVLGKARVKQQTIRLSPPMNIYKHWTLDGFEMVKDFRPKGFKQLTGFTGALTYFPRHVMASHQVGPSPTGQTKDSKLWSWNSRLRPLSQTPLWKRSFLQPSSNMLQLPSLTVVNPMSPCFPKKNIPSDFYRLYQPPVISPFIACKMKKANGLSVVTLGAILMASPRTPLVLWHCLIYSKQICWSYDYHLRVQLCAN